MLQLLDVLLHPAGEASPPAGEDEPLPLLPHPVLVLLGLREVLERHVAEPDPAPAVGPGHVRPVAVGAGNAALGLLRRVGAVALAVGEVAGGEETLAVGVLAGGVVGEVAGAEGDRGRRGGGENVG